MKRKKQCRPKIAPVGYPRFLPMQIFRQRPDSLQWIIMTKGNSIISSKRRWFGLRQSHTSRQSAQCKRVSKSCHTLRFCRRSIHWSESQTKRRKESKTFSEAKPRWDICMRPDSFNGNIENARIQNFINSVTHWRHETTSSGAYYHHTNRHRAQNDTWNGPARDILEFQEFWNLKGIFNKQCLLHSSSFPKVIY